MGFEKSSILAQCAIRKDVNKMEPKYVALSLLVPLVCLAFCVGVLNNSVDRRIGLTGVGPLVSPKRILVFSRILSVVWVMFGFGYFLWAGDSVGSLVAVGGIVLGIACRSLQRISQRLDEWVARVNASTAS